MKKQRGIGFIGVLVLLIAIVFLAIIGMKIVPAYIEFFTIKKAVTAIAQSGELRGVIGPNAVRNAFQRRADIDDITAVQASDLEVTKDGDDVVIAFAYQKKIPIVSNISVLIDFASSTKPTSTKTIQ